MAKRWLKRPVQQELQFHRRGGKRDGAGRKRGNRVSHGARPKFTKPVPAHVTLGVVDTSWNLHSHRSWKRISECLKAARDRNGMRLIEFSVLGNHLHSCTSWWRPTAPRRSRAA